MTPDSSIVSRDATGNRRSRVLFGSYLVFIALYSLAFQVLMTRKNSSYLVGEWLIDYSGGFVRRGLVGTLVLAVGHATHIPLAWVVFPIQSGAFLIFLVCVYQLSKRIHWTLLMTAIMVSPATLAFTVLESYAGFRKETLLFAALALVICVLVYGRWRDWMLSALLTVVVVGLVLSHEALAVGLPYLLAAVLIQIGSLRRTVKICLVPAISGAVALVAVVLHPGNHAIAQAVCDSVGGHFLDDGICGGAIQWLEISLTQARAGFVPEIYATHMIRLYCVLVFPVFIPPIAQLVMFYRRDGLRREVWIIVGCGLISLVGTAALFYSALDWGRWVHMQAICLMLVVMMVDGRSGPIAVRSTSLLQRNRWVRGAAMAAIFLYGTIWTLPLVGDQGEKNGYIENFHMLRHLVPTPPQGTSGNGAAPTVK